MKSRSALLEAMKRLVATDGVRATSVARITETAGVAKGLFFYYFKTKEAAIIALTGEIESAYMRALVLQSSKALPSARLSEIITHHFRFIDEHREDALFLHQVGVGFRPLFSGAGPGSADAGPHAEGTPGAESPGDAPNPAVGFYQHLYSCIRDAIDAGVAEGDFSCDDPEELAYMILGSLHGLSRLRLFNFKRDYDVVGHLVDFYGRILRRSDPYGLSRHGVDMDTPRMG